MSIHSKFIRMRGFTLLELAIVLTVAGVMLLAALKFVVPMYEKARYLETQEKMRIITEALGSYALRNFRVPCPADPNTTPVNGEPYGSERFSGTAGDALPPNCGANAADWSGVIPFATLGIPETTVRDAWGRNFTYAISPAFALDTTDVTIPVHPTCRVLEWYYPKDNTTNVVHRNPRKARFCCVSAIGGNNIYDFNTDLVVQARVSGALSTGLAAPNPRQASGDGNPNNCVDNACEAYAPTVEIFTRSANITVPTADRSTGIAYVLLSHGRNGIGAYLSDGTRLNAGAGGPDEIENDNDDRVFIERSEISESPTDYFDDLVIWRTQDLIYAEQGESCVKP